MALNGWEFVLIVVFGGLLFSGVLTSGIIELGLRLLSARGKYGVLSRLAGIALILSAVVLTFVFLHGMWATRQ